MSVNRLFLVIIILIFILNGGPAMAKKDTIEVKETAMFKYDSQKKEVLSVSEKVKDYMKMKFVSITMDQPVYWPNEDVNLKILMPVNPSAEIKITLQKKDATPKDLGTFKLNDGGVLVEKILSGEKNKIEVGEYRVSVTTADKKIEESSTFSVVEGHLGAVSFAYEFEQLTTAEALKEVKGGWFLGNAEGVGKRWGNGLNVKNEVRVLNQPYTGAATVRSRCYLPGCNGCEAGAPQKINIEKGVLEASMEVGGHSGPFELEVVTDKGDVRNLFGRSGHVERQSTQITGGFTTAYNATLAPYEGTQPVPGREIYIEKTSEQNDDSPLVLHSPICDHSNKIEITIKREIKNAKGFVYYMENNETFKTREVKLEKDLKKGQKFEIECPPPYAFAGIAGFVEDEKNKDGRYYEAWVVAFTPSPLEIDVISPESGIPLSEFNLTVKAGNKSTNKGVAVNGILEVFDNRVASKSPKEPLVSSIGDSFRDLANTVASWRDWTGMEFTGEFSKEKSESLMDMDTAMPSASLPMKEMSAPSPKKMAPTGAMRMFAKSRAVPPSNDSESLAAKQPSEEPTETIREGEKKVVYCAAIKTDANGEAKISVKLPPQTGRCKIRFVAVDKFDYIEKVKDIDVSKKSFAEASFPLLITPGSNITARLSVVNTSGEAMKLKISGACLEKDIEKEVKAGANDLEFGIIGRNYGELTVSVIDKDGKSTDKRAFNIKNISAMPVTFSDIIISDGSAMAIEEGKKVAVYANPARLLGGIAANMNTTMYSWFGHAEAISASAAIRAMLLRAMAENILNDEGLRDKIKADLIKSIKDLNEKFYNKETGLVYPYPGVAENITWSIWVSKNLSSVVTSLSSNEELKAELGDTINTAAEMLEKMMGALAKKNISIPEYAMFDPKTGQDVIPVEIDGKIVYKAVTDNAVMDFFRTKALPALDIENPEFHKKISGNFTMLYDKFRFLRAFERTGAYYYMLINAKALLMKNDKNFSLVFNKVARGLINTGEPGLIQGPALLGGVYSAPQTMVKFLDLLIAMARESRIAKVATVKIISGKTVKANVVVSDTPYLLEVKEKDLTLTAHEFVTVRIDNESALNMFDHLEKTPFFDIKCANAALKTGDESMIEINLNDKIQKDSDAADYYAIVALPSNLSLMQTEDLLADYRGQLLYGQKTSGGESIQLVTVPFRGSKTMSLKVKAVHKGESEGFVTVRHMSDPDFVVTLKTAKIKVE